MAASEKFRLGCQYRFVQNIDQINGQHAMTILNVERARVSLAYGLVWVLVTTVGTALGWGAGWLIAGPLWPTSSGGSEQALQASRVFAAVFGLVGATVISIAQWSM